MIVEFFKYQGTGNDFILIDDRSDTFNINDKDLILSLCERRFGIGADGLIILRNHNTLDFEMIYFNSDGNQSSMCGNGGRCIVSFAIMLGIVKDKTQFMAIDGVHKAKIINNDVYLQMNDVTHINSYGDGIVLDTGSPHYVKMVDSFDLFDVYKEGKRIRSSDPYKIDGINVNFVVHDTNINVRTYERGVEDETFSCGTGVVATVIAMHYTKYIEDTIIDVYTRGGVLSVSFEEFNGLYRNIWLSGEVNMVYAGDFEC
jgi:diaminopimelate epimerase